MQEIDIQFVKTMVYNSPAYVYFDLFVGEVVEGHPAGTRALKIAIVDIDIHHGNNRSN
jgi:hypothetical protein